MGILPACLHRVCTAREGQRWCWITLGLWLQTGDSYHVGAGDQEQSAFLARESLSRLQPHVSKFSETVESVGFSPAQSHTLQRHLEHSPPQKEATPPSAGICSPAVSLSGLAHAAHFI